MISALLFATALAASDGEEPAGVPDKADAGEIIVTGERIRRTTMETASSVHVLEAEAIDTAAMDRLDDVLMMVPNVQFGSGEEAPAIRGMDSTGVLRNLFAFLGGTRPRATLQIDGRPANYYEYVSSVTPMWDIERIEVYRSPQTTTQGRNSIAGAIFIETEDPTFGWHGRSRLVLGDADTGQFSAALSGPIVGDQLAFRFSGDIRSSTVSSDMADFIADADIDRDDYEAARLKLLYRPAAMTGLEIAGSYSHTRSQAPQFEAVRRPFEERRTDVYERTVGVNKVRSDAVTARVRYASDDSFSASLTVSHGDALIRRLALKGFGQTRVEARDTSAEAVVNWKVSPSFSRAEGRRTALPPAARTP
ncbi:TonB-dependent receptor plug domain-containing protein [Qipengyuania sphaerica]|uniref:TonB-dependent receptor plug domain-containing protein n=1 Tax=Qipengyuania sphaerica TaxID=2867243 RepID=UPI001C87C03F|nr:TonB-dependent receptor plug domain-containing protein [Qipengyuania sphaerica]MBX7540945.1 TonB-dependent receptor plug domain-containing protein [Qipengyuania sphaerica]